MELRPFEETLLEYQGKIKKLKIINTKIGKLLFDIIGF